MYARRKGKKSDRASKGLATLCKNSRYFAQVFINTHLTLRRSYIVGLVIFAVLLLDQAIKFYIKTHFEYNEDMLLFGQSWARLHFVENEGMAFGITFGWSYGKLLLSVFRILMVVGLFWYLRLLLKANAHTGLLVSVALITAGAIGNIIDSAFYGLIFTESPYYGGLAQVAPFGKGYGTFLHGKVVDMLYFPMKWIAVPEWIPYFGGQEFLFFSPIFNIADAAITCGVFAILVFQRFFFKEEKDNSSVTDRTATDVTNDDEWAQPASPDASSEAH